MRRAAFAGLRRGLRAVSIAAVGSLSVTTGMSAAALAATIETPPTVTTFDTMFQRVLRRRSIPGGAYALIDRSGALRTGTYGFREVGGDAVDEDTLFPLASVSKGYAGILTLLLEAEGGVSLDMPIILIRPSFRYRSKAVSDQLTLRHVISQSSGVTSHAYDNLLEEGLPWEQIMRRFHTLEPVCLPGQCYGYQNVLFGLVASAVEHHKKEDYAALIQQRLFSELGMTRSVLGAEALLAEVNKISPHERRGGQWVPAGLETRYLNLLPAAGVSASVGDAGKWLMALSGRRPDVIASGTLKAAFQARVHSGHEHEKRPFWRSIVRKSDYGFGFRIYTLTSGRRLVFHSGGLQGLRTSLSLDPATGQGLVMMINGESSALHELATWYWSGGRAIDGGDLRVRRMDLGLDAD